MRVFPAEEPSRSILFRVIKGMLAFRGCEDLGGVCVSRLERDARLR